MKTWQSIVVTIIASILLLWLVVRENFHAITEGELYRSAQLSAARLAEVVAEKDIQTVISLRRPQPDKSWWTEEKATALELGIGHHDIGMDLTFSPRIDDLRKLRDLIQTAPRPILMHCEKGADRTGLAAIMAKLLDGHTSLDEARQQVSLKYHVVRDNSIGIPFFDAYTSWLEQSGRGHTSENFNHWLDEEYVDLSGNIHFLVDPIRGQTWWRPWGLSEEGFEFEVHRSDGPVLELSGWAFDTRREDLLAGVEVFLGDQPFGEARYGIHQPWLSKDFDNPRYLYSGWAASDELAGFADGCHDLHLRFTRLDGSQWTTPPSGRICISP